MKVCIAFWKGNGGMQGVFIFTKPSSVKTQWNEQIFFLMEQDGKKAP